MMALMNGQTIRPTMSSDHRQHERDRRPSSRARRSASAVPLGRVHCAPVADECVRPASGQPSRRSPLDPRGHLRPEGHGTFAPRRSALHASPDAAAQGAGIAAPRAVGPTAA